jgi:CHAT domain-containing protein
LKVLQESSADHHCKTGALVIGNPHVGDVVFRGKASHFNNLPCAEKEAEMIGKLLGVKPFIGPQATKDAIRENLQEGVAVIHFAGHGTTEGEIALTPSVTSGIPEEHDYILTIKEVQESGIRPQLVVLSCCHSGRGEIKAEGVIGMSRAFLAAGARAVVASLWAIDDEATMIFMEKFYSYLIGGESASASLQKAMKGMREIEQYNEPRYWAPFFLIGDDVTIRNFGGNGSKCQIL